MSWYLSLGQNHFNSSQRACMMNMYVMQQLVDIYARYDKALAKKKMAELQKVVTLYESRGGTMGLE